MYCVVLMFVAVSCRVLRCVNVCKGVLLCIVVFAVYCGVLMFVAGCYRVLRCVNVCSGVMPSIAVC